MNLAGGRGHRKEIVIFGGFGLIRHSEVESRCGLLLLCEILSEVVILSLLGKFSCLFYDAEHVQGHSSLGLLLLSSRLLVEIVEL